MSDPTTESEIRALRQEIERLNNQRWFRLHASLPKIIGLQFLRGMALGLGTVVGATILVSILALFLSKIDYLPIIGGWAREIAAQIQSEH